MKHGGLGWTQGAGVRGTETLYEVTSTIEERGQTDLTLLLLKVLGGDQMSVTCRFAQEDIFLDSYRKCRTVHRTCSSTVTMLSPQPRQRTAAPLWHLGGPVSKTESSQISQA